MCFSTYEQQYIDALAEQMRAKQASRDANARLEEVSKQSHDPVDAERGLELLDAAVVASGLPEDSPTVQRMRKVGGLAVKVLEAVSNGLPQEVAIQAVKLGLDPRHV